MAIRTISLVHIGDVHYPDLLSEGPLADVKDRGLAPTKVDALVSTRVAEVTRALRDAVFASPDVRAVIHTGDLTTRGDISGYESGLRFLESALHLGDSSKWQQRRLVVVPGNHDIDRRSIDPTASADEKFSALMEAWGRLSVEPVPLSCGDPIPVRFPLSDDGHSGATLDIFPLNTCFLCGEYRAFPQAVRGAISKALESFGSDLPASQYLDMLVEQVDCPAVELAHIVTVERAIRQSASGGVPLIAGHHPIIPQALLRVDGYSELLNGGYLRETLLATKKNVIYLHGHIHEDPIHVISNQKAGPNRIVSLSAPALRDGFNVIEIAVSNASGQAIGIRIIPYRFLTHHGVGAGRPTALRLIDERDLWSEVADEWLEFLLAQLDSPSSVRRLNDLTAKIPKRLSKGLTKQELDSAIVGALLVAELLEIVEIFNREKPSTYWQCRRRMP